MQYITVLIEYADVAKTPEFTAHMELLGGHVVGVQFSDLMAENERLIDAISSDSPVRLASTGDIGAASMYEKLIADATGISA